MYRLIGSLVSMIASIMVSEVNDVTIKRVDREVKLFLSNVDEFDKLYQILGKTSTRMQMKLCWITKYNFQSLCNVPTMMKLYGPLVYYGKG